MFGGVGFVGTISKYIQPLKWLCVYSVVEMNEALYSFITYGKKNKYKQSETETTEEYLLNIEKKDEKGREKDSATEQRSIGKTEQCSID